MKWVRVSIVVVICLVGLCLFGPPLFEAVIALAFGWLLFLARVLPDVTWNATALVQAAVSLTLVTLLAHWLLAWIYRAAGRGTEEGPPPAWRFRWTAAGVTIVVLMFVAGISMIAIVHQAYWIASSDQPLTTYWSSGASLSDRQDATQDAMREIGLAIAGYESDASHLPEGARFDEDGRPLHGWATALLPYLGEEEHEIDPSLPWNHPQNQPAFKVQVDAFLNPALEAPSEDDEGFGLNHYAANSHVMGDRPPVRLDELTDGAANTILLGEINQDFRPWGEPGNWRNPGTGLHVPGGFGGSDKFGSTLFLMADGQVRHIDNDVDPAVLRALATPGGGEEVSP